MAVGATGVSTLLAGVMESLAGWGLAPRVMDGTIPPQTHDISEKDFRRHKNARQ